MTENVTENEVKILHGILIDVENEHVSTVEIIDDDETRLEQYYKLINCSMIDIATRKIGKKYYDIVCDDCGTWKENAKISAINNLGEPQLVGNLVILGLADEEGNETSLSPEDMMNIFSCVQNMSTHNFPKGYPMLTQCEV